jgi:hypothetical protein
MLDWSRKSRLHARFCQRAWGLRATYAILQKDMHSFVPFGRVMSELRITGTLISAGRHFRLGGEAQGLLAACAL